jgi:hypothetical protein
LHKYQKRLVRAFCSKFYRDNNRDINKSILIAGTGRSGTTWLSDVIASQIPSRIMFEPFHSELVEEFAKFHYFHYAHPREDNHELYDFCHKILTGDIRNDWIDRQVDHLNPHYRIIKDIRANLFLNWIANNFSKVPIIFIIRHPCAVVLSRMKMCWATDTDIEPFLSQPRLIDDFLADKLDIIRRATTPEQKHAVIWCVSNLVPILQFSSNGLNPIFYENLCLQPEVEIPKIFRTIGCEYRESIYEDIKKPSTTTVRSSAVLSGENRVTRWQRELTPKQVDNILAIINEFGLDYIYDSSPVPHVDRF